MQYEITLNDGYIIYPAYEPEHESYVDSYYNQQVADGAIKSWSKRT
jgi:hypothetical protein